MSATDVIIAHDYVTQRGGAERVVLALTRVFRTAPLLTALYNESASFPEFRTLDIRPSWLNQVRAFRKNPQVALPLLHFAWSLRRPIDARVVVASSSGWAHGVRVTARTVKIVYCHNPPRWIHQSSEYLIGRSVPLKILLRFLKPILLAWDVKAAATANVYIANSSSVADRIKQVYGATATVLHPPVTIDPSAAQVRPVGAPGRFFLTVGRKRGYKGTAELVRAFAELERENLVVVGGIDQDLPPNVTVLSDVDDAQLRWLYANAIALVSASKEDFGLTPLEANAFGTPALLVRAGGFLDSLHEGVSGEYLEDTSVRGIVRSVEMFPRSWESDLVKAHAAKFNAEEFEKRLKLIIESAVSTFERGRSAETDSGSRKERRGARA